MRFWLMYRMNRKRTIGDDVVSKPFSAKKSVMITEIRVFRFKLIETINKGVRVKGLPQNRAIWLPNFLNNLEKLY